MDMPVLLKGIILGFSIAAPVGPIGVLCIRRTLTDGRAAGVVGTSDWADFMYLSILQSFAPASPSKLEARIDKERDEPCNASD